MRWAHYPRIAFKVLLLLVVFAPVIWPLKILESIFTGLSNMFATLGEGISSTSHEAERLLKSWSIVSHETLYDKLADREDLRKRLEFLRGMRKEGVNNG